MRLKLGTSRIQVQWVLLDVTCLAWLKGKWDMVYCNFLTSIQCVIPLERSPLRIPWTIHIFSPASIDTCHINSLFPTDEGVLHAYLLTIVCDGCSWEEQCQHVHTINHISAHPACYPAPVMIFNLEQEQINFLEDIHCHDTGMKGNSLCIKIVLIIVHLEVLK